MAPIVSTSALSGLITPLLPRAEPTASTTPTRTIPQALSRIISARQAATTTVVSNDGNGGDGASTLTGGAIAGIVIGSIAGFLLLLWLIRSCLNLKQPGIWGSTFGADRDEKVPPPRNQAYYAQSTHGNRHRSRSHGGHGHRSRSRHSPRRTTEVVSVTRPVYVEQRGRSPRAPQNVYVARGSMDGRDLRRASDSRRYRNY
ncbi:Uu.00g030090.m01.CDS01 [Anthostomella pinea]|uniref:Uu.00g030090.m01.CDS01 n=1 Tax=Anthostomella pinea TaxID=933095 RepID=A0AAI8V989_9PEZI|nr:Uu.00g030090.m01.CDS01 [Anthostomella pinea]